MVFLFKRVSAETLNIQLPQNALGYAVLIALSQFETGIKAPLHIQNSYVPIRFSMCNVFESKYYFGPLCLI